jgi:hypothetical protein
MIGYRNCIYACLSNIIFQVIHAEIKTTVTIGCNGVDMEINLLQKALLLTSTSYHHNSVNKWKLSMILTVIDAAIFHLFEYREKKYGKPFTTVIFYLPFFHLFYHYRAGY